jgi:quercetin dioxygenase-like cupin family protein
MDRNETTDAGADALWFLNTRVTIRRPSGAGPDRVSIIEHLMPAGDSPPLHVHHDEDEVFHVIDGEVRFRVGDEERVARAGDTIVAPRGVPHGYRVESADGARCVTMTVGPDFETLVRTASRTAAEPGLPEPTVPTPAMQAALAEVAARNRIDLVGPPMA